MTTDFCLEAVEDAMQVAIEIKLEKIGGIVRRPAGTLERGPGETQGGHIKVGKIGEDDPNQMIFRNQLIEGYREHPSSTVRAGFSRFLTRPLIGPQGFQALKTPFFKKPV